MDKRTFTRQTRIITRPRLVSFLLSQGITPEPTINPFNPDKRAWMIPDDPETRELVDGFLAALKAERGERE